MPLKTLVLFFLIPLVIACNSHQNNKKENLKNEATVVVTKVSSNTNIGTLQTLFLKVYKEGAMSSMDSLNKAFKSAVHFYDSTSNFHQKIKALNYLGRSYLALSKPAEAFPTFLLADSLYQAHKIKDTPLKHSIDYYSVYAKVQFTKKLHFNETVAVYEKYKNEPRDAYVFALSEEYLARVYIDSAKYDKAIPKLQSAIAYFERESYNLSASIAYSVLGVAYDGKEDIDRSLQAYQHSIAIGEKLKEPNFSVLASNSYNIGLMYQDRLGNATKAITYLEKAVAYDQKNAVQQGYLVDDYTSLAAAYLAKFDLHNAKIYAELALSIANEKLPETEFYRRAIAYFTLSNVLSENNENETALVLAQKGYVIITENTPEKHRYVCNANLHLGNAFLKNKDTLKAISCFKKTAQIAKDIDRAVFEVQANKALLNLSKNPLEMQKIFVRQDAIFTEKFENAYKYQMENELQKLNFYEKNRDTLLLLKTFEDLSNLIHKEDLYAEIAIQLKAAEIAIFNEKYNFNAKKAIQAFIQKLITSKNNYQNPNNKVFFSNQLKEPIAKVLQVVYQNYKKTKDKDYLKLAFQLMEVNKNTVLLQGLQYVSFKNITGIPKEIFEKEEALQEKINSNYQYIHYYKNNSSANEDSIRKLFQKQLAYEKEYTSFLLDVEKKYPNYANAKKLTVIKDYSDFIKNKIQEDEVVLLYFMDTSFWYRMELTKKGVQLEQFKNAAVILNQIERLQNQIYKRQSITTLSNSLSESILPRFDASIKRITIIADDFLNVIPFEILQVKNHFLFESKAIRYAGSVQLLNKQMELQSSQSNSNWVGFAPQYTTSELPNNAKEVARIQEMVGGKSYLENQATKENFIAESGQSGILHLATHTELNQVNPMFNQMWFSSANKKQSLTATEVYNLNIPAHLAVLSSCNTGFGKLEKSEGLMSMSRSFTYAGVSSTLMSMWKVPDKETSEIMVSFYKYLSLGKPKDEALQFAKLEYLKKQDDEALKHPYYWAGFIVSGNVEPLPTNQNTIIYFIFGALLLGLGLFFLLKWKKP